MTDASADDLPLAADFPPATREQWRKLVEDMLKGAPLESRLLAKTYDTLAIEPLSSRKARAQPIAARPPAAPWSVMQRVDHPDPAAANAEALYDLENGATGLSIVFAGAVGAYRYGLPANGQAMARALEGIHLDTGIALDLEVGPQMQDTGYLLAALLNRRGVAPARTHIRFGFDPIGIAAVRANPLPSSDHGATLTRFISDLAAQGFRGPLRPPTVGSSIMPADRRDRSSPSCWQWRLNICACSKRSALRSMPLAAWSISAWRLTSMSF